jgi:ribosomal protein S18 acetylase RimI-like enzyme
MCGRVPSNTRCDNLVGILNISDASVLRGTRDVDIIRVLALAFQSEPAWSYILPNAELRRKTLPGMFRILLREDRAKGCVFGTSGLEAVTVWRKPGFAHDSIADTLRTALPFLRTLGSAVVRGAELSFSIAKRLPPSPCWYLHFAACDPVHQRKGFGGAAIRAGLAQADLEKMPAYLETAEQAKVGFYRKFGFEVEHTWTISGGPTFWGMRRPA